MGSIVESLVIRPIHPDDAVDLYEIVQHPSVVSTITLLPSMEFWGTEEWIKNKPLGAHRVVAELDGKVIGSADLDHNQRPRMTHSGDIGISVHHHYWGQGVGTALMEAILDLADNWLNLSRVELNVFVENTTAIRLYKKFGFDIEGTRCMVVFGEGKWHDEYLMARIRSDFVNGSQEKSVPARRLSSQPLSDDDIKIRPLHRDDAADLHELYRHPAVDRTTLQMPSLEISHVIKRIESQIKGLHRMVAEVEGRVVGSINIFQSQNPRQAHSADLGMMVHPDFWGRGIGSKLMATVVDLADNWLNVKRLELEVNTDNPPAIGLYKKFGFEIEGTKRLHAYGDGRWADSHFMARIRQ